MAVKIILNPIAGRGYGARSVPLIQQYLSEAGVDFELVQTNRCGHATELAAQAYADGFDLIVAAGGDGTSNEVLNGLMAAAADKAEVVGTMGLLPVGSGSDFPYNVGVPGDLHAACARLAYGKPRIVDVCRVSVDGASPRYFDNTVNVGFGGLVTLEANKVKWVRGMALYLPVVLKTVFLSHPAQMTIEYGEQTTTLRSPMVCVANGPREGGGFFCNPDAQPDDGLLDACIVRDIQRLKMLALVPHFMDGSHVGRDSVVMARTSHVRITSPDFLVAHMDGEMLCTEAHRLDFDILPGKLRVWC
ncbi:MAG: diacylglycerol kinase family lipid kinase [Anaerolineae bacterium]|nr:diacylglycerol kinase family lipid kinase [Anaerolineae bacterium]